MARRKPPTSPITFSAGTWTSVRRSSPVSTPRTPILWSVLPTSTPSQAALDDEGRDRVVGAAGGLGRLGEDGVPVGLTHAGHPALGAVEHPPARDSGALVGHRPGTHAHDVAAGLGLGQPEGGPLGAVADAGEVALLLVLGAGDHDGPGGQAGQQEHQRRRVGVLGHFLHREAEAEDARPGAAVLGRDAQPEQPGVTERLEEVLRVGRLLVDGAGPWPHLVLSQTAHRALEVAQLVGQVEMHGAQAIGPPGQVFSGFLSDDEPEQLPRSPPPPGRPVPPVRPPTPRARTSPRGPSSRPSGARAPRRSDCTATAGDGAPCGPWAAWCSSPRSARAGCTSTSTTATTRSRRSTPSTWCPRRRRATPSRSCWWGPTPVPSWRTRNSRACSADAADQSGQRSDVTMLARFVPATKSVTILSDPTATCGSTSPAT